MADIRRPLPIGQTTRQRRLLRIQPGRSPNQVLPGNALARGAQAISGIVQAQALMDANLTAKAQTVKLENLARERLTEIENTHSLNPEQFIATGNEFRDGIVNSFPAIFRAEATQHLNNLLYTGKNRIQERLDAHARADNVKTLTEESSRLQDTILNSAIEGRPYDDPLNKLRSIQGDLVSSGAMSQIASTRFLSGFADEAIISTHVHEASILGYKRYLALLEKGITPLSVEPRLRHRVASAIYTVNANERARNSERGKGLINLFKILTTGAQNGRNWGFNQEAVNAATELGGEPLTASNDYALQFQIAKSLRPFRGMHLVELNTFISDLERRLNDPKWRDGLAFGDIVYQEELLEQAKNLYGQAEKIDSLEEARAFMASPDPFPLTLADRVRAVGDAEATLGVEIPYLNEAMKTQFNNIMFSDQTSPGDFVGAIYALVGMLDKDIYNLSKLGRELKDYPHLAYLINLASNARSPERTKKTMSDLVMGFKYLANKKDFPEVAEAIRELNDDYRWNDMVGRITQGLFSLTPDHSIRLIKGVKSLIAARVASGEIEPNKIDEEMLQVLFAEASGAEFINGKQYGGLISLATGSLAIAPSNMDADLFAAILNMPQWVGNIRKDFWKDMSVTGEVPHGMNDFLRNNVIRITPLGGDRYKFMTMDGAELVDSKGNPYIADFGRYVKWSPEEKSRFRRLVFELERPWMPPLKPEDPLYNW